MASDQPAQGGKRPPPNKSWVKTKGITSRRPDNEPEQKKP